MGSSGSVYIIDLNEYPFEVIKQTMLDKLLEWCPTYSYPGSEKFNIYEEYYFRVAEIKTIDEFNWLFNNKVLDYDEDEDSPGIFINGRYCNRWSGDYLPQISDNYLVIYNTDLQMDYQSLPYECLRDFISDSAEIWS
jgi:hypothetical protein